MKRVEKMLKALGLRARERRRILAYYRDDPEGLREYVLYLRLMDDRHEYVD